LVKNQNSNLEFIKARDLPDAWFQCIYQILDKGRKYKIDRGSYKGQERLEFDYITVHKYLTLLLMVILSSTCHI